MRYWLVLPLATHSLPCGSTAKADGSLIAPPPLPGVVQTNATGLPVAVVAVVVSGAAVAWPAVETGEPVAGAAPALPIAITYPASVARYAIPAAMTGP